MSRRTYTLRDDGTVDILNRGFDRARCRWEEAQGRARFQRCKDVASLSVTFFWPFAGAYHLFELDKENYQFAVVSGPSRDYVWKWVSTTIRLVRISSHMACQADERMGNLSGFEAPPSPPARINAAA